MLSQEFAERFAQGWIQAWNERDLDEVMRYYSSQVTRTSPWAQPFSSRPGGTVVGREELQSYWKQTMDRQPQIHCVLIDVLISDVSVLIYYDTIQGIRGAEVCCFNSEGLIERAIGHFHDPQSGRARAAQSQ